MFKRTKLSRSLMLAFGGTVAVAALMPAQAQVVITGSSIKQIEGAGALPVQTLTRADIERTGVQTTEQLLQTISAMSSSGQIQGTTGVGISTYGESNVSLRGIGPERTLVMVNNQRLAAFAGGGGSTVNVNNIPLAAIERVEILKDGASAVYGSDAVAGVVNFILQKNFQGIQIGGTYGTPTASGGGQQYQANVVAGIGDLTKDRYNLTGSLQWNKNQDLLGVDRDFSKTANKVPYFVSGATGQGNIQGGWQPGVGAITTGSLPYLTSGSGYGNPMATPTNLCGDINMALAPVPSAAGKPFCNFDTGPFVGLLGSTESVSATLNGAWQLNDKVELYGDLLWSQTTARVAYQPSPLRTDFMNTDELFGPPTSDGGNTTPPGGTDRVLLIRPTNPNYQIAADYLNANGLGALVGQPLGITARVFDFGRRTQEDKSTQFRIVGGARGDFMNQSYDVSAFWNQNKMEGTVTDGYFSMLGFAQATQDPNSDWNPWSLTQSAAFQAAIAPAKYVGPTLSGDSKSYGLNAVLSGEITPLPAGPLQYAAGYQYRHESLVQTPAPAQFTGDIAGLGGATKPIDADRSVNAFFGELNIPVIKNLDVNLAIRWDDYSDFGSTTNWKGNFRWQPMQQLLLRGSYGTGFRAPTLSDLYSPIVLQTSSQFDDPVTGQTDLQVNEFSGGNPNLNPETSTQYSLGFVFQPLNSLAFGIDYFNIKVEDVIAQASTQEVVTQAAAGNPAFIPYVTRAPDPVTGQITQTSTQLLNAGMLEVQGFDITANYRETLGPGVLSVGLQGTYYTQFDQTSPAGTTTGKVGTTVDGDGNPVPSSTAGLDGYGVVLRYKQYLTATWTQGDWAATIGNSYATGYHAGWDLNGNPTRIGAMSLWDLVVAYSGFKNIVLTLGARNIFDTQPDTYVSVSNAFQSGYDSSQYDPRGRFVFLTGTFKF
jgi:iron complex outermembrane receptor protein